MLNKTAIILNLIIYFFLLLPLLIMLFSKKLYNDKKSAIRLTSFAIIIEVFLSALLYKFSRNIFSFFNSGTGIINISVFISRIVFLSASLYPLKILLPAYLFKSNKKTVILALSKITVNIVLSILGYVLLSNVGILYSFPICDLIYYIIYVVLFIKS